MAASLSQGLKVAHYTLERPLGRGAFGEVWLASAGGGFQAAVKFLPLEGRPTDAERRSLELLRTVRHPNLVEYQYAGEHDGHLVIAMGVCDRDMLALLREHKD